MLMEGFPFLIRRGGETVSLHRCDSKIFTRFLLDKEFPVGISEGM